MADPVGSIYVQAHATDELSDPVPYEVESVGQAERMIPDNVDCSLIDRVVSIPNVESFKAVRRVAGQHSVLRGPNGGLALAASTLVAAGASPNTHIVTALPEAADRHLSRRIR